MSLEYIQQHYNVPAKIGGRIKYTYRGEKFGTITGESGPHLMIKLDGEKISKPYHPTWEIEYLENNNEQI